MNLRFHERCYASGVAAATAGYDPPLYSVRR